MMKEQHAEITRMKQEQAEARFAAFLILYLLLYVGPDSIRLCRLQYLLNQSDIFGHFGVGQKPLGDSNPVSPAPSKRAETRDHRQKSGPVADLDEDELEMLEEEKDDDELTGPRHNRGGTVVARQPSIIMGEMRYSTMILADTSCDAVSDLNLTLDPIRSKASAGWYVFRKMASTVFLLMKWV